MGRPGPGAAASTHLRAAIDELGLPDQFADDVVAAANRFHEVDADTALARGPRRDLRSRVHVTIDGEDARDFDDAVSAEKEGHAFRVWVSIADVASYVKARSILDKEAALRGTSVYLPARVLPMLPEKLSNGLCSLVPGLPRLTLTCEMVIDTSGVRSDIEVYPSLINSAARLTYTHVQAHIDGTADAVPEPVSEVVENAIEASTRLRRRRFRNGSLDLEISEAQVVLNKAGEPTDVIPRVPLPAHGVVEDLMIAANESVAEYLLEHGLNGLFRVHPPPPAEKWTLMAAWAKRNGLRAKTGKTNTSKAVSTLLERLKKTRQSEAGQMLLLRSLSQAYYSAEVDIHFGLASEAYSHFTSPIRRYPDLLVHRALWNHWQKRPNLRALPAAAENSSKAERQAIQAERDIVHLCACLVARRRLGEVMAARIVGVHSAGLFVRPDELFAEGLIPIRYLGEHSGDYFEVSAETHTVIGRRTHVSYTLGDAVTVRLASVDLDERRINFELAPPAEGVGRTGRQKSPAGPTGTKTGGRRSKPAKGKRRTSPKSIDKR